MKAFTISGGNLVRITAILGFVALCLVCGALTMGLAFAGYVLFLVGAHKGALCMFAGACIPLVTVGVVGALLAQYLRPGRARRLAAQEEALAFYRSTQSQATSRSPRRV